MLSRDQKTAYLTELRRRLAALPGEEREAALTYYEEYFDDVDDSEVERVLAELGPVEDLAEQILSGYSRDYLDSTPRSSSTHVPARAQDVAEARRAEEARAQEETRRAAEQRREEEARAKTESQKRVEPVRRSGASTLLIIVLVILALPLLLPLAIAFLSVGIGLIAAAIGVAAAMVAVVLALGVAGVVLLVAGFGMMLFHALEALIAIGVGLSLLGLALLSLMLCVFIFAKLVPGVIRFIVQVLRWPFERRVARA